MGKISLLGFLHLDRSIATHCTTKPTTRKTPTLGFVKPLHAGTERTRFPASKRYGPREGHRKSGT